jgi:hypothetical protein
VVLHKWNVSWWGLDPFLLLLKKKDLFPQTCDQCPLTWRRDYGKIGGEREKFHGGSGEELTGWGVCGIIIGKKGLKNKN